MKINKIKYSITNIHILRLLWKCNAIPALGESIICFRIYDNNLYSEKRLTEVKTAHLVYYRVLNQGKQIWKCVTILELSDLMLNIQVLYLPKQKCNTYVPIIIELIKDCCLSSDILFKVIWPKVQQHQADMQSFASPPWLLVKLITKWHAPKILCMTVTPNQYIFSQIKKRKNKKKRLIVIGYKPLLTSKA